MNDHDYPSDDHSHWGSSSAALHEMPPEDFEVDYSEGYELTIKNLLIALIVGLAVIFIVFGVFS